jgi:uncharacterized protein YcbK (DUF882 family)
MVLVAGAPRRELLPAAAALEAPDRDFTPASFVRFTGEARAEPSLPYRSFARLGPVRVWNINSGESAEVTLYDARGEVRGEALEQLGRLLCDWSKPDAVKCAQVEPRTIQLMMRAAYRFGRREVVVISAYREPRKRAEGLHALGRAIDFKLPGVPLAALASYVRSFPRAGIGVHTHPDTQYVHVDSRQRSYHWGDSSGPGLAGGHWSLGGLELLARQDAAYTPASDWPEGTRPPPRAAEAVFAEAPQQQEDDALQEP